MENEPEQAGSMSYICIFSAVALFMLLIACINYMKLQAKDVQASLADIGGSGFLFSVPGG